MNEYGSTGVVTSFNSMGNTKVIKQVVKAQYF